MKIPEVMVSVGILLGWAILGSLRSVAQEALATGDATPVQIQKTAEPVKVDGVLDEECWKTAVAIKADYIKGGDGKISDEPRMIAKYAWDDHYLYIGYEIFDTNLVVKGNGVKKGPADNQREGCEISPPADVTEFFIGFDDTNMFWEVHHSAANNINDILVFTGLPAWKKDPPAMTYSGIYWATHEYIQDEGAFTLSAAVQMKPRADGKPSTINDGTDTDTGFTAEMRFPWAGIGAPASGRAQKIWSKMAGQEITILAVTESGELKDRPYHTSCAKLPRQDFFHTHFAVWPRYKLVAETPSK